MTVAETYAECLRRLGAERAHAANISLGLKEGVCRESEIACRDGKLDRSVGRLDGLAGAEGLADYVKGRTNVIALYAAMRPRLLAARDQIAATFEDKPILDSELPIGAADRKGTDLTPMLDAIR